MTPRALAVWDYVESQKLSNRVLTTWLKALGLGCGARNSAEDLRVLAPSGVSSWQCAEDTTRRVLFGHYKDMTMVMNMLLHKNMHNTNPSESSG